MNQAKAKVRIGYVALEDECDELWSGHIWSYDPRGSSIDAGFDFKVIDYESFRTVCEALQEIKAGCLVPPDGGQPNLSDAIEIATEALKKVGWDG